jgi:DNA-binding response OmpR family regulator
LRILIIEDNPEIAANLYGYLEARGNSVDAVRDGDTGFHIAASQHFDAILLDLGLPGMDGSVLCRKLRDEAHADTPILVLTARDTLKDKLAGFENGADDYLVKPFALEEVEARLAALHKRRTGKITRRAIKIGDLSYDSGTMSVKFAGVDVKLPPKCMQLLESLMSEPGRLFSRHELEMELWGDGQETSDRLRSHMHLLRRALLRAGGRDPIKTVHGLGFRLALEE